MAVHITYSHDTVLRALKARQEVELLVRAYVHALNTVGNTNQEAQILTYPDKVRIYMTRPSYQFEKFSAEYCKLLKENDKTLVEIDCWLRNDGYSLNGTNEYQLSADDLHSKITDRAEKLGPEFKSAFNHYIEQNSLSKTPKQSFLGKVFNKKAAPASAAFMKEMQEFVLPFYKAYRYAAMQERQDIGDIAISQTKDQVKIEIEVLGGHKNTFMELTRNTDGFVQNAMKSLSGSTLAPTDNRPLTYSCLIKLFDQTVKAQGDNFKKNYERYLTTNGNPQKAQQPRPNLSRLSR